MLKKMPINSAGMHDCRTIAGARFIYGIRLRLFWFCRLKFVWLWSVHLFFSICIPFESRFFKCLLRHVILGYNEKEIIIVIIVDVIIAIKLTKKRRIILNVYNIFLCWFFAAPLDGCIECNVVHSTALNPSGLFLRKILYCSNISFCCCVCFSFFFYLLI